MESKPVSDADNDARMVGSDFEAAETLAGLAAVVGGESRSTSAAYRSQDQAIAVQQFCGNTSTVVTGVLETNETVSIVPSQPCSTSYPSNSTCKSRPGLTKAEKEARRIRRVLANRESARQTIRRRQATYLEFTKKAADLTQENESLKKEKELAMKEYKSLKDRNADLKIELSKLKKPEPKEAQEEPKSTCGERVSSATMSAPFLPYNHHPVFVPFLLPSVVPSSNVFPFPYSDAPSIQDGQRIFSATTGSGSPMFVLPVPCLLPCLGHGSTLHSCSDTNRTPPSKNQSTHQCSVALSYQSSSSRNTAADTSNSTKAVSAGSGDQYGKAHHHRSRRLGTALDLNLRPGRNSAGDGTNDPSSKMDRERGVCHHKKVEDVVAATNARKRRKELMTLKNVRLPHHHPVVTSANMQ
ncbi:uncharacterized protein LOC127263917 isoform X1 [Andrographis paniculata]|uniref:uncharacterized protein LOC127263917 isoform X1 n=1 Tax=Andrographis paniculata TaxID=175694 RepID=UPI0021E8DBD7|nr:uncharacterized protein LOC127263917 isoform X1 [Andrographis paniculata]